MKQEEFYLLLETWEKHSYDPLDSVVEDAIEDLDGMEQTTAKTIYFETLTRFLSQVYKGVDKRKYIDRARLEYVKEMSTIKTKDIDMEKHLKTRILIDEDFHRVMAILKRMDVNTYYASGGNALEDILNSDL